MTLADAQKILEKYNREPFHLHHARVVSGVMSVFARELDPENAEHWAVVGLLHDVDFERYPERHCVMGEELLKNEGVSETIIRSAMSHGYGLTETPYRPEHIMEKLLFAADELTGLIGAAALMRPSRSVQDLEVSSVRKKFKDKKFAAGCSREVIAQGAQELGWELDELFSRTILAMREIEDAASG
ncbi:MAG: hydrolase [Oscillospiraceae bacterium]|jgi:predicted hydrolase (HD superfamily)|nr:hydrolase [Oscillospiraceae bacterium]